MGSFEPNGALRALLSETGWSPRQLADEVNKVGTERRTPTTYKRQSVVHWLNGHVPMEENRPLIREAFARKLDRSITYADLGMAPPKDDSPNGSMDTLEGLADLARSDMDPSRRSVVNTALFSSALGIPKLEDLADRVSAIRSGRTNQIGQPEVELVKDAIQRFSDLDYRQGGRHTRPQAAAFIVNTVVPFLRANAPEAVRKAMLSAASDLCYLTGYMAVDEGIHGMGQRYYLKALELAGEAEDRSMYVVTLCAMSSQAVNLGHGAPALRLADSAIPVSAQESPNIRAHLTVQKAYAAAATGDVSGAHSLLSNAEALMARAQPEEKAVVGHFGPSTLARYEAQVHYSLGKVRESVRSMQESVTLRSGSHTTHTRSELLDTARLAERQCEMGHLEGACATWNKVLDSYKLVHSGRCDDRITEMLRMLKPYARNHHARALWERAREEVPSRIRTARNRAARA
ncbi:tetratricopeptide repeat protein [Streptomyces sp. B1866]|uniref:tetratricopeptide repeat protein n=1 Tax=Streptomyces sp. B1866 TaxID=3075431 RepID=UPI0028922502|nr:tetratricopeptide repeat protein [Streptomyces sp. B1866]MDT3395977.1 tetratricopeptide repeat protein [Streptomyces sp. B1866]